MAVDEANGLVFIAGYTNGEYLVGGPGGDSWTSSRTTFRDFIVTAYDIDTGESVWVYQDGGRDPAANWAYLSQTVAANAAAFDTTTGYLIIGGEMKG